MGKPAFDPSKPFEKPAFDPSKPFKPAGTPAPASQAEPEKKTTEPGLLRKGIEYATRALDYSGGLIRTGIAGAVAPLAGKAGAVTPDDILAAAKGQAPTSAEYMERLGVPEGASVELPVVGKTSARDVGGFAMDVATDPLTALAKAAKPAARGLGLIGKKTYKSSLKKVDQKLAEKGLGEVSDVLLAEGKTGTTKKLAKDLKNISGKLGKERQALYDEADRLWKQVDTAGTKIDMNTALSGAEKEVAKMRSDPGLAPMADKFEELLNRYKSAGPVDIKTASEWKTNLYNALPESAFDQHGKLKGPAQKFRKALAGDFRKSIIDAGESAKKGLGHKIDKVNEKWASVISAEKPMVMQARRASTPNLMSSVDAMITGYGFADPQTAASILALKKSADLSKTTWARTKAGKGLIDLGEAGLIDPALQRGFINMSRGDLSPKEIERRRGLLTPRDQ